MSGAGATGTRSTSSRGTARKSSGAGGRSSGEPWRDDMVRATGVAGADELEGETAEEPEELEIEELSDDEEAELPVKPAVPEEEESEW